MVITFFKMPATTLCLGTSAASTLRKNKEKGHKVFINFASFSIREVVLFLAFFLFFLHRLHHLVLSDLGKRLLIHSSPPFSLTLSLAALLKSLSLEKLVDLTAHASGNLENFQSHAAGNHETTATCVVTQLRAC